MDSFATGAKFECLLFDMDDTIYPMSSGINLACRQNIQDYMASQLAIEESEVPKMCLDLYKEYGTTMAGLKSTDKPSQYESYAVICTHKYKVQNQNMDDTIYPMSSGINLACRQNIQDYMASQLAIEESEVPKMCLDLYKEYGTTMAGLKALGYEFDYDDFHANVHGKLPYHKLRPDPVLKQLLLSMPQRKIIFTNSDKAHAAEVLTRLGLEECFEGVICFETLNEVGKSKSDTRILCKPNLEAMEAAIQIANIDPKTTIFLDDSARNIATGKAAGFHTVVVGTSVLVPGADVALESIHNIKEALPEIWEGTSQLDSDSVIKPAPVETVVRA